MPKIHPIDCWFHNFRNFTIYTDKIKSRILLIRLYMVMSFGYLQINVIYCRYLRRGKDIADSQLDVVNTEVARLQQRCESLEKQLDLANKDLTEERQKSQVPCYT